LERNFSLLVEISSPICLKSNHDIEQNEENQ
jgi:hypothetical protein